MEGLVNKGMIGEGSFGCVYLIENPKGEQFALKVMEWVFADSTEQFVVMNELNVLEKLSHKHVLTYIDHYLDKGRMHIITNFCSGGDLGGFLQRTGRPLPEDLLKVWLWQMACGLKYMHTHENGPLLHRDLKPGNVFLTDTGHVRLGDMGIARVLESPGAMASTLCGTPPYMSPEILCEKPYNAKADMWSLGCCVVEMATLQRANEGASLLILRDAVLKKRQPLPRQYSTQLDTLLSKLLEVEFEKRISSSEVLDDPLLHGCDTEEPMELLKKHNMTAALTSQRAPASSTTLGPHTEVRPDEEVPSLQGRTAILDDGETITGQRTMIDHGRRQDDDTVTSTAVFRSVVRKPKGTMKANWMDKTPEDPAHTAPLTTSQQAVDALSMTFASATVSTVKTEEDPGTLIGQTAAAGRVSDASSSVKLETLPKMEGLVNKGLIGKGAFGCVYLMESTEGEQFALKVMEWVFADFTEQHVIMNELNVLEKLSHEHVLTYIDHYLDKGRMHIITKFCSGGDLRGFLQRTGRPLPEDLLKVWLWQMACGLKYMHTHENGPLLHRDLKPGNVFLTDAGHVRLGDMGIARVLESPDAMATSFRGNPPYMSPETQSKTPYNAKTDVWSLGCCVMEMATLEKASEGSLFILRDVVLKKRQPLPRQYSTQLDTLLSKLLEVEFEKRISSSEVLDDPLLYGCDTEEPMELLKKHNMTAALTSQRAPASSTTPGPHTEVRPDEEAPSLQGRMSQLMATLDQTAGDALSRIGLSANLSTLFTTRTTVEDPGTLTGQATAADRQSDASRPIQLETLRSALVQAIGEAPLHQASAILQSATSQQELMGQLGPLMEEYETLLTHIVMYFLLTESTVHQSP